MGFVKSAPGALVAPIESQDLHLARLKDTDAGTRRRAAQALAHDSDAALALSDCLAAEGEPNVRSALFGSLVSIGGPRAAKLLASFLRSDDAALRGGAVDALKQLQEAAVDTVDAMLNDPDPDLRLLAIEVARVWTSEQATPRLQRIFEADPHVNVCAAALDVATQVGDAELLPALDALRMRFPDELYLCFAIDVVRTRIGKAAPQ